MSSLDRSLADRLEHRIGQDVGRNVTALVEAARGGLARAAEALSEARSVVILTGFFIPAAEVPAAETDGPIGAVFLAQALVGRGVAVRLVTDSPCAKVIEAAIDAAGLREACPLDVVAVTGFAGGEPLAEVEARIQAIGPSHVVAIERCGPGADGRPRNMRGEDIGGHTAELHRLFQPPAYCIGIGDGGNELGMGSLPLELIAAHIAHGEVAACRVPADTLVVAGVSNWAGAALALLLGGTVDGAAHDHILAAISAAGGVDGVTRLAAGTVDNVDAAAHRAMIDTLAAEARQGTTA
ncbi:MAG: DUF4392 domain-containing protein [Geminicoccaceae bacterium]|nr:MAG: DUF4392 domain-containing protein [Geminicoccaceae bacterium]